MVERLADEAFWRDPGAWRGIVSRLPPYRLSKFQPALPDAAVTEMLGAYLLDREGARAWVSGEVGMGRT